MEVSAGKLEGVEGGSAGVSPAKEAVVRVVALLLSDMGVAYCGGVIQESFELVDWYLSLELLREKNCSV
jgi:hypothetical protein